MITRRRIWLPALVVVVAAVAALLCWGPRWHHAQAIQGTRLTSFPAVDPAGLNPTQVAVVDQLRDQFQAHHPKTFYSQGKDEPWCADFVSWIMHAAGHPLANPNSGSWRIPGVGTLQDYYQSAERFRPTASGYLPQVGDVVMYNDTSPFHQHTNIVVADDAGTVTTVGGNELGGVSIHRFALADDPGVVGFGLL
ncbi:CHAP domain-containing protein [Mycobacterium sp. pUA109]|uniref:CHAP domain-containing protein n=1 Tax=Mycobacterium sp. pUA109 TaxID=3238982 RepID=UPI00351B172A